MGCRPMCLLEVPLRKNKTYVTFYAISDFSFCHTVGGFLMDFDGENILPLPCPASSMIDLRRYFVGAVSGRIGVFDGDPRWCTADELVYHEQMRKHDHQPPWEKKFVFSENGISQRSVMVSDSQSGAELLEVC